MRGALGDVGRATRALGRRPGAAAAAVLALGLGIGGNLAVLDWVRALLLRPFPFERLDRLVTLWERHARPAGAGASHQGRAAGERYPMAAADVVDLAGRTTGLERLSAYRYRRHTLLGDGEPQRLRGVEATPDFFATLGVEAARGRLFTADEARRREPVVVVSDAFWRARLGADPGAIGRAIHLDGETRTVVGVMPAGFAFPLGGVAVWAPLGLDGELASDRVTLSIYTVGRLADGRSRTSVEAELERVGEELARLNPSSNRGRTYLLAPLAEPSADFVRPFLLALQTIAALVFLIAAINVGSLLLARTAEREGELAVHAAIGAGAGRLAWLVVVESLVLAALGGAVASAVAALATRLVRAGLPADFAQWVAGWRELGADRTTLAAAAALAVVTALGCALPAALAALRVDLARAAAGARAIGGGSRTLQRLVVAGQLLLAAGLGASAASLAGGLERLVGRYDRLEPAGVLTFGLRLPAATGGEPAAVAGFWNQLLAELASLPGVESAALVSHVPADPGPIPTTEVALEGVDAETEARGSSDLQTVSPGYFTSLRIALLAGRLFGEEDRDDAVPVALASESLALRFAATADGLVGRRIRAGGADGPWLEIVGVVADVPQYWFDAGPRPTLYRPYLQNPRPATSVLLRTAGDPIALAPPARRSIHRLAPALPIEETRTLDGVVADALAFVRTAAGLATALAVVAGILGAVGAHGLVALWAARSTAEIGLRMALGASRWSVAGRFLGQTARLAGAAAIGGAGLAWALSGLLSRTLYGLGAARPASVAGVAAAVAAAAVFAALSPALRAARVEPAAAIRSA